MSQARGSIWLVPLLTAVLGLSATLLATRYVAQSTEQQGRERFHNNALTLQLAIEQRMMTYIATLQGGVGLFMGRPTITRHTFKAYAERLGLQARRPGIQGIGFAQKLTPGEQPVLERRIRQEGVPDFRVWPESANPLMFSIIYLEPQDWRNKRAIGYDMYNEPVRREAISRAIDSGRPALSGKVVLVQEAKTQVQPGFLVYMPVYREDADPAVVAERRQATAGMLYAPFRAGDLFGTISQERQLLHVDFEVYDGTTVSADTLLYDSDGVHEALQARPKSRFSERMTLSVGGRTWTLFFTSSPVFESDSATSLPLTTLVGGLVSTLLLFAFAWIQAKSRQDAFESQRRADLLAEVSGQLNTSLELSPLLQSLVARLVSKVADFCAIDLADEGGPPQRVAAAGADVQLRAPVEVPLKARGKVLGRMVFAPGPHDAADQTLLEEVANRAALAVDNARLFQAERRARQEAEEAAKARESFLSIASHELKTPLTTLLLQLDSLLRRAQRDPLPGWVMSRVEASHRQALRLNKLIEQLLDVSRISAGRLSLEREWVNLTALIREVASRHDEELRRTGSPLDIRVLGPITGLWDRLRLDQVITNLLSNAIKYGAGKPIVIAASVQGDHAVFSVSDQGIGISPDNQARLFGRFERLVSARHYGGFGLGLWIVRQILEAMGGAISVESTPGQGSVFTVRLPLAGGGVYNEGN